jgi:hypothetical protein
MFSGIVEETATLSFSARRLSMATYTLVSVPIRRFLAISTIRRSILNRSVSSW